MSEDTPVFSDDEQQALKAAAERSVAKADRATCRTAAEGTLLTIRHRLFGADERMVELIGLLRSGQGGSLGPADVAIVADALEAESLHLTLESLRDIDPFPGFDIDEKLSISADNMPAFLPADYDRLKAVIGKAV